MKTIDQQAKDNKWFPRYIVLFFVGLALLDGIFVYLATSTFSGLVTEDAYNKGLKYNETIKAYETQKKLGWSGKINLNNQLLSYQLLGPNKQPLDQATVTVFLSRPTQSGFDYKQRLAYQPNGTYQATLNTPLKGVWDATIVSEWNNHIHQTQKRLNIN